MNYVHFQSKRQCLIKYTNVTTDPQYIISNSANGCHNSCGSVDINVTIVKLIPASQFFVSKNKYNYIKLSATYSTHLKTDATKAIRKKSDRQLLCFNNKRQENQPVHSFNEGTN